MKKLFTCLLATLGLTTACGQQSFENTDVPGFAELMEDTNVVVLDVRTAAEYAEGHIEKAILIDQGQSDFVEKARRLCLPTRPLPFIAAVVAVRPVLQADWLVLATSASISKAVSLHGRKPVCQ